MYRIITVAKDPNVPGINFTLPRPNIVTNKKLKEVENKISLLDKKKVETERVRKEQIKQLESISGLSETEAKESLLESLKKDAENDALIYAKEKMEEAELTVKENSKKIILIDVDNFWNPMQKLLKVIYKEGFLYNLENSNIIFKKF